MDDFQNELEEPYNAEREKALKQELNAAFTKEDLFPCEIKVVKRGMEQWKQGK